MNRQRPIPPSRRDRGCMHEVSGPAGTEQDRLFSNRTFGWNRHAAGGFGRPARNVARTFRSLHCETLPLFRTLRTPNSALEGPSIPHRALGSQTKSDQVRPLKFMNPTQYRKIALSPDIPRGGDSLSPPAMGGTGWNRLPVGDFGLPARTWRAHSELRPVLRLAAPKPSGGGSLGEGGTPHQMAPT